MNENPGLKTNVISMYKSRFKTEGFFRPRIFKDLKIPGKYMDHTVDIYFEFIQMNNLERTIIRTIESIEVTDKAIWEFVYVLKDLHFFSKGIIYYDGKVSSEAKNVAALANIDLMKFDFYTELKISALNSLKTILPDDSIIGDPFWIVMEITQNDGENTGICSLLENAICLFLSKKQANSYCGKLKENAKVFGISQNHLKILVDLKEKGMCPDFYIVLPEFEQLNEDNMSACSISHKRLKKFYLRDNDNE